MGIKLSEWYDLVAKVLDVNLVEGSDVFCWSLNTNKLFSVRSMYKHLINNGIRVSQEI